MKKTLSTALLLIFVLTLVSCAGSKAVEFQNADFEALDNELPAGWTIDIFDDSAGSIVAASWDDERQNVVYFSNSAPNDARICQTIDVEPDTTYMISCYIKTSGVAGGAGANIGVKDIAVTSSPVTGTMGWQRVELIGKTAGDQTELTVRLGLGGYGAVSSGEAWFDCVDIKAVDVSTGVMLGKAEQSQSSSSGTGAADVVFPSAGIAICTVLTAALMLAMYSIYISQRRRNTELCKRPQTTKLMVFLLLAAAFIVRIIISIAVTGHKGDISCFTYWGNRIAQTGMGTFYETWCDYPPGYMLVLGIMSKLSNLLGAGVYTASGTYNAVYIMLMKLPCVIADIASAYLVYVLAKRVMSQGSATALMSFVAFSPIMIYVSSAWGQIDQVFTVLIIIAILLFNMRRPIIAGLVYGLAITVKPQALMVGPIFAAAYILYVLRGMDKYPFDRRFSLSGIFKIKRDTLWLRLLETFTAVMGAVAVIVLVALPFTGEQEWYWLIEKYYNTATSYNYATVNAYNFWALVGANWTKTSEPFAGLTYGDWGTIFMALFIVVSTLLYMFAGFKDRVLKVGKRKESIAYALPLTMAFMLAGIFTFGHFMHERYLFPVLMLIMVAYVLCDDIRLLWTYMGYSVTMMLNCMAAFYYSENMSAYQEAGYDRSLIFNDTIIFVGSLLSILMFAWFAYVTFDLIIRNNPLTGTSKLPMDKE